VGDGLELGNQFGELRPNMKKRCERFFEAKRRALYLRVVYIREILLAYLSISLIESACLFPAVWMR
jgi:hypothetical protein